VRALLEDALECEAILRQPGNRAVKGLLACTPAGLSFEWDGRSVRKPDREGAWQSGWSDLVSVDFVTKGPQAKLTASSSSGLAATFDLHSAYADIEYAALCIAAATPITVTLEGVVFASQEAREELDRMDDEASATSPPACDRCGGTQFVPRRKTSTKVAFGVFALAGRPQHAECVTCGRMFRRPN
jgi:hypothetical protein